MRSVIDTFVLVSDDALLQRALTQLSEKRAAVIATSNVSDALRLSSGRQVRAIVVDGCLLKATAVRELTRLRSAFPLANVLFVAAPQQTSLLNDVQPLRVEFVARPLPQSALSVFVERTLSSGRLSDRSMRAWIAEVASECRLTRNDVALMPLVLDEETHDETRERLGLDE